MKKAFNKIVLLSLILGVIGGIYLPDFFKEISFLGTIYINLLKFMIIPIIFTTITVSIYNSIKIKNNILLKTLLTFLIMFVVSFLITSLLVVIINPAANFNFNDVKWTGEVINFNLSNVIINLFPTNLVSMIEGNQIFPAILFASIFGYSASKVKDGKKSIDIIESFREVFNKILEYIIYLTPIGVFALIGNTVALYGTSIIDMGAKYIGMAYLSSSVVLICVMIIPVWVIAKINPIKYVKKIYKVWLITISTCSSAATLPYTIKVCNDELNIPKKVTDIVVPLGCTIHMCGGAVSFALLGLFTSSLFGIEINMFSYLMMLISATLINMAAPGIPNGGIVIGATYLSMFNIPLNFIGFYSGIYKLLDMAYTTLNVTGDISANVIINKIKK